MLRMPSDLAAPASGDGGDVVLLQHHLRMLAERPQRHVGIVLGADRQHDAAGGEFLQRKLEVDESLAIGAAAEAECPRRRRRR